MENKVGRDVVIVYVLARRKTLPSLRFTLSETRVIFFLASTEVSVKCRKMRYFGNQKKYVPKVYYFADWKRFLAEIRRTSLVANCYCASSLTQKEELYMLHKKLNTTTKVIRVLKHATYYESSKRCRYLVMCDSQAKKNVSSNLCRLMSSKDV